MSEYMQDGKYKYTCPWDGTVFQVHIRLVEGAGQGKHKSGRTMAVCPKCGQCLKIRSGEYVG